VEALTGLLVTGEQMTRVGAAQALGDLRDRGGVAPLIRCLRANDDGLRNSAVKALARIGDPAAVPALVEVAQEDEAAGVRTTAIDSLAKLNAPQGVAMLAQLAIKPATLLGTCTRYFDAPTARRLTPKRLRQVQRWATRRLRELHATDAAPLLRAALGSVDLPQRLRLWVTIRSLRS